MSAVMQAIRRGHKHRCGACGAAFYDLDRDLTACPKCEAPYGTAQHMPRGEPARKRQSWSKGARRPEPETVPDAPAAEAAEEENEGVPILDTARDAEQTEHGEEPNEAAQDDDA